MIYSVKITPTTEKIKGNWPKDVCQEYKPDWMYLK